MVVSSNAQKGERMTSSFLSRGVSKRLENVVNVKIDSSDSSENDQKWKRIMK